jgi:DNA-binding PadR family transcriptional regulator
MPDSTKRTKRGSIPILGYALLGLIREKASSGYDLRKIFAETAMGNYSSSPGAIYPALQRLEIDAFVTGKIEETAGLRRRCVYHITKAGSVALKEWLALPVASDKVKRDQGELMLRFAFMERVLGPSACVSFLRSFGAALSPYIVELEAFLTANREQMPLSARLAFENGLRNCRCTYDWTLYALQTYEDFQRGSA